MARSEADVSNPEEACPAWIASPYGFAMTSMTSGGGHVAMAEAGIVIAQRGREIVIARSEADVSNPEENLN